MTVRELQSRMDSREFGEWLARFKIEAEEHLRARAGAEADARVNKMKRRPVRRAQQSE